jgi:hypothetical protein
VDLQGADEAILSHSAIKVLTWIGHGMQRQDRRGNLAKLLRLPSFPLATPTAILLRHHSTSARGVPAGASPFASMSMMYLFISAISLSCASIIASASALTLESEILARSLVRMAMEWCGRSCQRKTP